VFKIKSNNLYKVVILEQKLSDVDAAIRVATNRYDAAVQKWENLPSGTSKRDETKAKDAVNFAIEEKKLVLKEKDQILEELKLTQSKSPLLLFLR
jgi:hypothetical protein